MQPHQTDTLPPSSDTSLKATVTHIQLYCNEMHGHAMSLGVQTAVCNIKWHEISSVLGSLGLGQAEVDRTKGRALGEGISS